MEKTKTPAGKGTPVAVTPAPKSVTPTVAQPPPLFRRIDWLTFFITTLMVWIAYYWTLAPDLTLEDSGELAVGSFYAGIPHPPGYPVWTIYTWLWTVLVPFKNIAWRVALGEATAAAVACGLLGFVVSRGSSMMMEGIADLKDIAKRWENSICLVSGFVAGGLLGFNGYMWSQSIIVEVYSFSVLSLMLVLVCLLRWMYAPHQRRFLYWAFFIFGICFTNHQTLIVAAMGIEIAIAAADFKMGRSLFLWNSIAYLCGLILHMQKLLFMDTNPMVFTIFHVVGICSIVAYVWFVTLTRASMQELTRDAVLALGFIVCVSFMNPFGFMVALAGLGGAFYLTWKNKLGWEWMVGLTCGLLWIAGAAFYLYMPLAGMSCPPMQWGYPRTVEGFFHALTRGQYEKTNPTDFFGDPMRFVSQLQMFAEGIVEEFNWVYALLALVPFLYFSRMQKRERAWVIGITAIYLCLGVLLLILLNPPPDRQARELIRVFFTASHVCVAMAVGYGLTLIAATLAMHYESARRAALLGGAVALDLAVFALAISTHAVLGEAHGGDSGALISFLKFVFVALTSAAIVLIGFRLFFKPAEDEHDTHALTALGVLGVISMVMCLQMFLSPQSGIDQSTLAGFAKVLCWLLAVICFYFATRPRRGDDRMTMIVIGSLLSAISLGLTFVTVLGQQPKLSGLGVFFSALQKTFNADQYALPVIATMILVASALIYLVITAVAKKQAPMLVLLGLFALMPLHSFLSHWADNEQRGHLFGYWFGHDMFTPPFKGPDGQFGNYDPKVRAEMMKDPEKAKFIYPEMTRDAILYGGTDPGRFCPTYVIFCESFIPASCKPLDPLFDRRDVYIITQNALADGTYLNYIRSHYNRSAQHDMPFFQELLRPAAERDPQFNYSTNLLARVALNVLDKPLTKLGANIEARRRKEGVYPPKEMIIASPDDSQRCFQEYLQDAQKRLQHDKQFPNEMPQIKPGEDVKIIENRVQVSGQVAVMAINGLLTKVMFDKNPTNEFFVEESFPLDWMYPHLTPFGVIMKINRKPLPVLPEEVMQRDHDFWSQYSGRLIGTNVVTYDTPVKDIAAFVEKVYLRHDFSGFQGDRKFIRDDQGQKAFSKLRSSIGGVYAWRIGPYCAPEYRPKSPAEVARIYKEADFTFRQAFAFCPYSPEAVFRYINLLIQPPPGIAPRLADALLVAQTCLKLDPYNGQVIDLVRRLGSYQNQSAEMEKLRANMQQLEDEVRRNPSNYQAAFNLASTYVGMQQTDRAVQILDRLLADPHVKADAVLGIAQAFAQMNNWPKLEATLERLVKLMPNEAEPWYDLAALKAALGKKNEALQNLARALELNASRRATNAAAKDLVAALRTDDRFATLRAEPQFQKLVGAK